jgi:transcriptional regulator with XRE-family HTH domain
MADAAVATPTNAGGTEDEIDAIRRVLGINQAQLATILGTTARTVSRWKTGSAQRVEPRPGFARALRDLGQLRWLLETDLGADEARRWMRRPNDALRGRAPVDVLLDGDIDRVLGLVITLAEGGVF